MCLLNILLTLGWDLMFTTSMLNPKQIIIIFQIYISLTPLPTPPMGGEGRKTVDIPDILTKTLGLYQVPEVQYLIFSCALIPPNPLWCALCVCGGGEAHCGYIGLWV